MSASEQTPPPNPAGNSHAGRTRRSAAVKGKSAWASLLPNKKTGVGSDVESENLEEPVKRESPKNSQLPVETVSQKRARVGGKKPRLQKAVKVNSQAEISPSAAKSPEAKAAIKVTSPVKPPATPSPVKKEVDELKTRKETQKAVPSPAKVEAAASAVRSYRTPQQAYSLNAGSALNKEQLQEIEREVYKHRDGEFDDQEEEDEEQEEGTTKLVLDDLDDEDFLLPSKKSAKRKGSGTDPSFLPSRNYTPRGGGQAGRGRGRPKGSLNLPKPTGGGIMRGIGKIGSRPSSLGTPPTAIMLNNNSLAQRPPTSNGSSSSGKQQQFVGASRDGADSNNQMDRRNLKVVRIRQAGPAIAQQRPTVPYQQPQSAAAVTSGLNKEIAMIAEKYHNRVVPGTTVQQFNDIVNQLSQELTRMVNEQANHRQYIDQLALTQATQMDMKDEKIRHLEHTVEVLQSKLLISLKKNQLGVLKHETAFDTTAGKQDEKSNGGVMYSPSPNELQKKRTHHPNELEPTRKAPRFTKELEDPDEELFFGSGSLDGDDEDTEVDDDAGMVRQVTL